MVFGWEFLAPTISGKMMKIRSHGFGSKPGSINFRVDFFFEQQI